MIPRKLIDIFFGRLWVLLLPVILAPAAVLVLVDSEPEYESTATVWVTNTVDGVPLFGEGNSWITPAQHQANALNDLLSTRQFRQAIAVRAGLLDGNEPPATGDLVLQNMDISARTSGTNLLRLRALADSPEAAAAVADATVVEFKERVAAEIERSSAVQGEYYQEQLGVAEAELRERQAALDAYVQANPAAAEPGTPENLNFDYRTLVARVEQQMNTVDRLNEALQGVNLQTISAPQVLDAAFAVQDSPEVPVGPVPVPITERVGLPFAALLLGALVSATYLYLVFRTDHTIRSSEDLRAVNVPVLGSVPELRPDQGWFRLPPATWLIRFRKRDFARKAATSISGASSNGIAKAVRVVTSDGRNDGG